MAALLERQAKLADVIVTYTYKQRQRFRAPVPAFCDAIVQGCCRKVEAIRVHASNEPLESLQPLAAALQMEGALPSLRILEVSGFSFDVLSQLPIALRGGAVPQLQELSGDFLDMRLEILADMLEARARNPGCNGLHHVNTSSSCLERASLEMQLRLLCVLLPSIRKFHKFRWNDAFKSCFVEVKALHLTNFHVELCDGTGVSLVVEEIMRSMAVMNRRRKEGRERGKEEKQQEKREGKHFKDTKGE
jgi:hypothetical protein